MALLAGVGCIGVKAQTNSLGSGDQDELRH